MGFDFTSLGSAIVTCAFSHNDSLCSIAQQSASVEEERRKALIEPVEGWKKRSADGNGEGAAMPRTLLEMISRSIEIAMSGTSSGSCT